MYSWWTLNTYGEPLTAVREFLHGLWLQDKLDGLLIPVYQADNTVKPRMLDDPMDLEKADPFAPLQLINAAQLVAQEARLRPYAHMAAVLRSCELRALLEMTSHSSLELDNWLLIGVDCLATFSAEDYAWRVEKWGSPEQLTQKTLQFARQGGIAAYRFRPACQMCVSPGTHDAHVNICLLGLPIHSTILINTEDEQLVDRLGLPLLTDGRASPLLIEQHCRVLERVCNCHCRACERAREELAETLPNSVDELIELFMQCAEEDPACQRCLEICPISMQLGLDDVDALTYDKVEEWLTSCVECGVCEDVCPKDVPLVTIIKRIKESLQKEAVA